MSLLRKEWFDRRSDRVNERDQVTKRNVVHGGVYVICPVLFCARVTQRDLLLIVEPGVVIACCTRVADPLPEPPANGVKWWKMSSVASGH